ncbi:TIGR03619 family F420-dependent LLM class oxidoreductase [Sphaerisporangium rubeum]|uniref:Putative F420-dependent oxidoreductase n=1 Tax=Sphaerisporangium rubeum TaxID=321317 RepID=A0A7X0M646_9ACTN|nr:LLM class F420-dependent oxidoreductase [Sphaerisporangium rubeum]MBB6473343.1 putative F420-dependent oxidoreductase [Sphaerisporangium rubeum]
MKFGLSLMGLRPRWHGTVAKHAEDLGFESVWMPEHLILPAELPPTYLYSGDGRAPIDPGTPLYDPWVMLAGVASVTSRIRLGTNVYVLPLRHPLVTARSVVSLDRLSGGRVTLGAGVGWLADEYTAAGQDFHTRGSRMDEIIPLLRTLWTAREPVEHHGRHYRFGPVVFSPRSLQRPCIPIEIGGTSAAALRRAGRLGDGWIELGSENHEELAGRIAVIRTERAATGRAHLPFEITSGAPGDATEIEELAALGVTRVVTSYPAGLASSVDDVLDWLDDYFTSVMAKC